jgi:hypothetical protein
MEDQFHTVRAADVEIVGDQGFEERAGWRAASKTRVRETSTKLRSAAWTAPTTSPRRAARSAAVAAASSSVRKTPDRARAQPVTDGLQRGRIRTGGKPLDSSVNPMPARVAWRLGPLVAVEPDLDRVREVGADLDERRTEIGGPEVEVKTRHPPVGLGKRKPRNPVVARALRRSEHVLEFLGGPASQ